MKLDEFFKAVQEDGGYKTFPTRNNSYPGAEVYRKIQSGVIKFNDTGLDRGVLTMILFGVTLPNLYFTEDIEGKRTCVYGNAILSTIKAILEDKSHEEHGPFNLLNRVSDVTVPIITFEPSTPEKQVHSFLFHLDRLY